MKLDSTERYHPGNKEEWRTWLRMNHMTEDAIWLVINKKGSASPNLTWSEAVQEALCFGWIDSTKKTIDTSQYMQYFSRRKPTSTWSKINKDYVEHLIETGRMTAAGLESIEIAKRNGTWSSLDKVDALIVPDDLKNELENLDGAVSFFGQQSKSKRKSMLYWVHSAKRPETRAKRIAEIARLAAIEQLPKQFK